MEKTHVIMGRVVDSRGRPVAGAMVAARLEHPVPASEAPQPAFTNRNGEFSLSRLEPGIKTLKVIKQNGYMDAEFQVPADTVDFIATLHTVYEQPSRLRVRLVDGSGSPVTAARLRVRQQVQYMNQVKTSWFELQTDTRGVAECSFKPDALPDVAAGKPFIGIGTVIVDTPGYSLAFIQRPLHRDCDEVLTLWPAGESWKGKVVDENGAPIAGARVRVNNWIGKDDVRSGGLNQETLFEYRTDARGNFELTRFSRQDMILAEISAPLRQPIMAYFDNKRGFTYTGGYPASKWEQRNTGGVFRLAPGGDITGWLVGPDGRPIRTPFRVDLNGILPIPSAGYYTRWTTATAEGSFTFEGLRPFEAVFPLERFKPEERARVKPEDLGWRLSFKSLSLNPEDRKLVWAEPRAVEVRIGKETQIEIRMAVGVLVEGRVVNAISGKPYVCGPIGRIRRLGVAFEEFVPVEEMTGQWRTWLAPGDYEYYFYNTTGPQLVETPRRITVPAVGKVELGTISVHER